MVDQRMEGIIFDLDGTLIDSLADIATAANVVLERFGLATHAIEDYKVFVGDGVNVLMERIIPGKVLSEELRMEFLMAWKDAYAKQWKLQTKTYEGIDGLLKRLRSEGYRMGILSNKPQEFTQACAAAFFEAGCFDPVWGLQEGRPKKPDPAGALGMATAWGLPSSSILYVGDTDTDMQTAVSAGMYPLGVSWGFRPREELVRTGARRVIDHPDEVTDVLKSIVAPQD